MPIKYKGTSKVLSMKSDQFKKLTKRLKYKEMHISIINFV
jgi:hypothetical protein